MRKLFLILLCVLTLSYAAVLAALNQITSALAPFPETLSLSCSGARLTGFFTIYAPKLTVSLKNPEHSGQQAIFKDIRLNLDAFTTLIKTSPCYADASASSSTLTLKSPEKIIRLAAMFIQNAPWKRINTLKLTSVHIETEESRAKPLFIIERAYMYSERAGKTLLSFVLKIPPQTGGVNDVSIINCAMMLEHGLVKSCVLEIPRISCRIFQNMFEPILPENIYDGRMGLFAEYTENKGLYTLNTRIIFYELLARGALKSLEYLIKPEDSYVEAEWTFNENAGRDVLANIFKSLKDNISRHPVFAQKTSQESPETVS